MTSTWIVGADGRDSAIGVNLYFSMGGETTPEALEAALQAAGSAVRAPRHSRPEEALRRAMDRLRARRTMRRGLEGRRGHELVLEVEQSGGLDYPLDARFRAVLDANRRPIFTPADHPAVATVMADFERYLAVVTADDLRDWFVTAILSMGALHKVPRGNLYFVPAGVVERVELLMAALTVTTASTFEVEPVASSEGALSWLLRSVVREAEGLRTEIVGDVERAIERGRTLGTRALSTRIDAIEALKEKLVTYEQILGTALPDVSSELEATRAVLVRAVLHAEAEVEV